MEWRVRRVGLDYHVDIDEHYYSAPHRLIREQLDARITERTIELFCRSKDYLTSEFTTASHHGRAVGDASASRNPRFESVPLQR